MKTLNQYIKESLLCKVIYNESLLDDEDDLINNSESILIKQWLLDEDNLIARTLNGDESLSKYFDKHVLVNEKNKTVYISLPCLIFKQKLPRYIDKITTQILHAPQIYFPIESQQDIDKFACISRIEGQKELKNLVIPSDVFMSLIDVKKFKNITFKSSKYTTSDTFHLGFANTPINKFEDLLDIYIDGYRESTVNLGTCKLSKNIIKEYKKDGDGDFNIKYEDILNEFFNQTKCNEILLYHSYTLQYVDSRTNRPLTEYDEMGIWRLFYKKDPV